MPTAAVGTDTTGRGSMPGVWSKDKGLERGLDGGLGMSKIKKQSANLKEVIT